jgi:hypothetical protein
LLDELDWELERRGHRFLHYAMPVTSMFVASGSPRLRALRTSSPTSSKVSSDQLRSEYFEPRGLYAPESHRKRNLSNIARVIRALKGPYLGFRRSPPHAILPNPSFRYTRGCRHIFKSDPAGWPGRRSCSLVVRPNSAATMLNLEHVAIKVGHPLPTLNGELQII